MQYSILGPFSRSEAEYTNFPTDNHDPLFDYKTTLELAGVEAFFADSGKVQGSDSYHGIGGLTVTFRERDVVLCESLEPFRAYYVGASGDMERLMAGIASRFRDDLAAPSIDIGSRLSTGMSENEVIELVERIYDAEDYHGNLHIKKALGHIGIPYHRGYVETDEIDVEGVMRRVDALREKYSNSGDVIEYRHRKKA